MTKITVINGKIIPGSSENNEDEADEVAFPEFTACEDFLKKSSNFVHLEGYELLEYADKNWRCPTPSESVFSFVSTDSMRQAYMEMFTDAPNQLRTAGGKENELAIREWMGECGRGTEDIDTGPEVEIISCHDQQHPANFEMDLRIPTLNDYSNISTSDWANKVLLTEGDQNKNEGILKLEASIAAEPPSLDSVIDGSNKYFLNEVNEVPYNAYGVPVWNNLSTASSMQPLPINPTNVPLRDPSNILLPVRPYSPNYLDLDMEPARDTYLSPSPAKLQNRSSRQEKSQRKSSEKDPLFTCDICMQGFRQKKILRQHQAQHTENKPFQCSFCNKTYSSDATLKTHKSKAHAEMLERCLICYKSFHNKANLHKHMQTHASNRITTYKCDRCDFSCTQLGLLKKHIGIHAEDKQFKCKYCHISFARAPALREHLKTHPQQEDKPFKCELCGHSFAVSSSLTRHKKTHWQAHGNYNYKCDVCQYVTNNAATMKNHRKTHMVMDNKPAKKNLHKCHLCVSTHDKADSLKRHIQRNHSNEKYKCEKCGKLFKAREYAKKHFKRLHPGFTFTSDFITSVTQEDT